MNAEQINSTQAVNDSECNNNYPTDNPVAPAVQNGATASGQETENVSETSSAKQRRVKNEDATKTGTVRSEEARAGNANEGTGNQASTAGGRAQCEENNLRE